MRWHHRNHRKKRTKVGDVDVKISVDSDAAAKYDKEDAVGDEDNDDDEEQTFDAFKARLRE